MDKKRKLLGVNLAVLAVFALLYAALASPAGVMTMAGSVKYPVYRGASDTCVSIQCSVTWDAAALERILEILEEQGVSITFGVTADWAKAHPTLLSNMAKSGHEIAAAAAPGKSRAGYGSLKAETEECALLIERITGERPKLLLCGSEDAEKSARAARAAGLVPVLSTLDLDCANGSAGEIESRASSISGGGCIIEAEPTESFASALPFLIEKIKNMGFDIVPTHKMLYNNHGGL
ncbi:MAG: polysaccharide deacetylase family protein [Clostridiales bacterium]|nr:polysaccharide deacetylase family protein [Clostridiales bacterium]